MSVQLTEIAAQEIKRVMDEQKMPAGVALRISVAGDSQRFDARHGLERPSYINFKTRSMTA